MARYRSDNKEPNLTGIPRSDNMPATDFPSGLTDGPAMVWPERDYPAGPTPGALQGDGVQLEYYEDRFPKLPACLDRRRKPEPIAEAA
jgi:hypothetical protein